jgi:predicted dehydrogenase
VVTYDGTPKPLGPVPARRLRLGTIGAGVLSSARIYPCLHTLPVELVAVCDLSRERADHAARSFGAGAVYTDHRAMLAEEDLDAAIVCVAPAQHAPLAIEAMEAGLHVYTEKPPAASAADAAAVVEASRRLGRTCMTGFKKRFAPVYRRARAAIADPAFGGLSLLVVHAAGGPGYRDAPGLPGSGFLLDYGIHAIDLARYLGGEVAELEARRDGDDSYAVTLAFADGGLGVLALSGRRSWGVPTERVEATGAPGHFLSVDNSSELVRHAGDRVVELSRPVLSTMAGDSLVETGFQPELAEFVDAVLGGREPESSIASSYRTMVLYERIAQAAAAPRRAPAAAATP